MKYVQTNGRLFVTCYSRGNIHDTYPTVEEWCVKDRQLPIGDTGDKNIVRRGFRTALEAKIWMDAQ